MHFQFTIYAGLYLLGAAISVVVATAAWRRRVAVAGRYLGYMMISIAAWALLFAIEVAAVEQADKITFSKLQYIAVNCAVVFLLYFAIAFAGRGHWLTPRRRGLLWVGPSNSMIVTATNDWHALVWPGYEPGPAGSNLLVYHHGPGFWYAIILCYLYNAVASVLLLRQAAQRGSLGRGQAISIFLGVLIPWTASLLYAFDVSPVPGLDMTPIAFSLTGAALLIGMGRYHLLDLIPVAREMLIETMPDGALGFDAQGRLVDSNPAAREALRLGLSKLPKPLIGQLASALLRPWPAWREAYAARDAAHIEISLGAGAGERIYDAQITPLRARDGLFSGHLTLLRDVTARARIERALRESEARFRRMSEHLPFPLILSRVRDRKLLYVNPQGAQLFGEPAEALIARDAGFYYDNVAERAAIWGEITRTGKLNGRELRMRRPDGTTFWAMLSVVVTEMEGEAIAVIALADISARKEVEMEREALIAQLQEALANVKTLSGLVPICAHCKKIRDDTGYSQAGEQNVSEHSQAEFTHGICPDCMKQLYGDYLETEEVRSTSQAPHFLKPSPPSARPQPGPR